jgi:hypothetical protein
MRDRTTELIQEIEQISPAAGRKAEELRIHLANRNAVANKDRQDYLDQLSLIRDEYNRFLEGTEYHHSEMSVTHQISKLLEDFRAAIEAGQSISNARVEGLAWDLNIALGLAETHRVPYNGFSSFEEWWASLIDIANANACALQNQMAPDPAKSTDVIQLQALIETLQEELSVVRSAAVARAEEVAQLQDDRLNEVRRTERHALAVKHLTQQAQQERARVHAMVLTITEPNIPAPHQHDYAWTPGIDAVRELRVSERHNRDGWQREEVARQTIEAQLGNAMALLREPMENPAGDVGGWMERVRDFTGAPIPQVSFSYAPEAQEDNPGPDEPSSRGEDGRADEGPVSTGA